MWVLAEKEIAVGSSLSPNLMFHRVDLGFPHMSSPSPPNSYISFQQRLCSLIVTLGQSRLGVSSGGLNVCY